MILKTSKDRESVVSSFKNLLNSPGWDLFEEILNANIEVVTNDLLQGGEDETKEDIDRLRDKLRAYKDIRDTPKNMIKKLTSSEAEVPDDDPYDTIDELSKRKDEKTNS